MAAHSEALVCGRYRLSLDRPLVMGVLNITPDSFADGGVFLDLRDATDRVRSWAEGRLDLDAPVSALPTGWRIYSRTS